MKLAKAHIESVEWFTVFGTSETNADVPSEHSNNTVLKAPLSPLLWNTCSSKRKKLEMYCSSSSGLKDRCHRIRRHQILK